MIDLHAHVLPGVDDGVRSLEEAVELVRRAEADGVTAVAATPHVRSDYPTSPERMESGLADLRRVLAEAGVGVEVLPGGEVDLGRLQQLDAEDVLRFTLAQTGRYLLVEFPYEGWPPALEGAIHALRETGIVAVLAHPERNAAVQEDPLRLEAPVGWGALVQVTSASVEGAFGRRPRRTAERLLREGLVHVLATDAHGPHLREGSLAAGARALGDDALARYLTLEVPGAIVAGDSVSEAPARLSFRRSWRRMRARSH